MIYPDFLRKGNTIGVTATSDGNSDDIKKEGFESAKRNFINKGYKIIQTENVNTSYKGRSSNKLQRASQFMSLIENKDINAIITARGGDFLLEILPYIDFEKIMNNPKWVHGYSDTTGISFCITTICDIATSYGENFGKFGMVPWHKAIETTLEILEGRTTVQNSFEKYQDEFYDKQNATDGYVLDSLVEWKNNAVLQGRTIGGCLDILTSLVGTKYDNVKNFVEKYKSDGMLWFLDNCELTSEGVLRALWQLSEAGWFKHAVGFVFGRTMTRKSAYDISFEEAVKTGLENYKVPIIFDADIGHKPPQFTIINGAISKVTSYNGKGKWEMFYK